MSSQLNLANAITITRILLIPVFLVLLLSGIPEPYGDILAAAVFILAAATDKLDGYVARRSKQVTTLGQFLDPLADKLLIAAALIALVAQDRVAAWVAMVIIGREIAGEQDVYWALNRFRALGVAEPVITLGERGVALFLDGQPRILPACRVKSVDTTAAGDTFTGALASSVIGGMALAEAVDFAQRAAAICVTRPGAQNAIPTREEVLRASF